MHVRKIDTVAEVDLIDGNLVAVVYRSNGPLDTSLHHFVVTPKGRVFIRDTSLGLAENMEPHVRIVLEGTRKIKGIVAPEPGPLPTDIPRMPNPVWKLRQNFHGLKSWLGDYWGTPEVARFSSVLDMGLLAVPGMSMTAYHVLAESPQRRLDVLDLLDRHPWLLSRMTVDSILEVAEKTDGKGIDLFSRGMDVAAREMLRSVEWRLDRDGLIGTGPSQAMDAWPIEPVAIKACAGMRVDSERSNNSYGVSNRMVRLLSALPPDWIPSNVGSEWYLCSALADIVGTDICRRPSDLAPLLAGTGGRFDVFYDRLLQSWDPTAYRSSNELRLEIGRIKDMLRTFAADVVTPAMDMAGLQHTDRPAVCKALLGYGTLVSLSDLSRRWHADEQRIRLAVGGVDGRSWPALTKPFQAPNRYDVVALTTAAELDAEGQKGNDASGVEGMAHCVGGRAGVCWTGQSHVFSVRKSSGRSFERISTFEVVMQGGMPHLREHRGRRNAMPSPEASAAVSAWRQVAGTPELPFNEESLVIRRPAKAKQERTGDEKLRLAIPAWSGLMKRKYRNMEPADLVRAVQEILAPPAIAKRRVSRSEPRTDVPRF